MTQTWQALKAEAKKLHNIQLKDLFKADAQRFEKFSLRWQDGIFDFSKQRVTEETQELLLALAKERCLEAKIKNLFSGELVNQTEGRPALHTALRALNDQPVWVNGENIKPGIQTMLKKIATMSEQVREGLYRGVTDEEIRTVLCLGIGGSDLGPSMVCQALQAYHSAPFETIFISNLDGATLSRVLGKLNPATTLCIVNSKTFSTAETLLNARSVQAWFSEHLGEEAALKTHIWAVTANPKAALQFGIKPANIFEFWDWVGGRYSVWSAVGLPIALMLGFALFKEFLQGAEALDEHFQVAPLSKNLPVLLGLFGVWNINFLGCQTHAVLPYLDGLHLLPNYLQQLEMESNGKGASIEGHTLDYHTSPVIWGGVGCNGQHAYMQLLHQSHSVIPTDFIIAAAGHPAYPEQQKWLLASALGQSKALMEGRSAEDLYPELLQHYPAEKARILANAKACPGNRPSTTMLFKKLTPFHLGALLALYEQKVFVQSVIWDINPFDQWGVELGKELAKQIVGESQQADAAMDDSSTQGLLQFLKAITEESFEVS